MKIKDAFGDMVEVKLTKEAYSNNGSLAIILWSYNPEFEDHEEYATLTVNFGMTSSDHAFLDTNNLPNAEEFVIDNELGEHTGQFNHSGYCTYPLYKFDIEKLEKISDECIKIMSM